MDGRSRVFLRELQYLGLQESVRGLESSIGLLEVLDVLAERGDLALAMGDLLLGVLEVERRRPVHGVVGRRLGVELHLGSGEVLCRSVELGLGGSGRAIFGGETGLELVDLFLHGPRRFVLGLQHLTHRIKAIRFLLVHLERLLELLRLDGAGPPRSVEFLEIHQRLLVLLLEAREIPGLLSEHALLRDELLLEHEALFLELERARVTADALQETALHAAMSLEEHGAGSVPAGGRPPS